MTVGTACGKVIVLGEHSVVYGRPALAAGITPGAEARFEPRVGDGVSLRIEPWRVDVRDGDGSDLARALRAALDALPVRHGPTGHVDARIHLPGGGGLGSSAALGVAVIRAVGSAWSGHALAMDEVLAAALAWETVFHGNPSGVDHTLAAHGGAGIYARASGFRATAVPSPLRIVIADTGERTPTRDMVQGLARLREMNPHGTETVFDAIATLVQNGARALSRGDAYSLGRLMDANHAHLATLKLSTPRTDALCRAAREAGALGAKLTGGGGGGCVIALPGAHEAAVCAAWDALEARHFAAEISSHPAP
ncbi:MAG: mevalonate kinase [Deltaproteobacteria bacterium]